MSRPSKFNNEKETEIFQTYKIDILLLYLDNNIEINDVEVKNKKCTTIKFDCKYASPMGIILNYNNEAYIIQKFNLDTIHFIIEHPEVNYR